MRVRHQISHGVDHEISKGRADRTDRETSEGSDQGSVRSQRRGNSGGARVKRPRPPVGFGAAASVSEQTGAIRQRGDVKEAVDGT